MSAAKYCPHCGQPYSTHAILGLRPNTIKARIYDIVKASNTAGIRSDELFDEIYADDCNGGPASGLKNLAVLIWHINQTLKSKKQRIRSRRIPGTHFVAYYLGVSQ